MVSYNCALAMTLPFWSVTTVVPHRACGLGSVSLLGMSLEHYFTTSHGGAHLHTQGWGSLVRRGNSGSRALNRATGFAVAARPADVMVQRGSTSAAGPAGGLSVEVDVDEERG